MKNEAVLVLERKQFLDSKLYFEGIIPFSEEIINFIRERYLVQNRLTVEDDSRYIQVVCYVIIVSKDGSLFLMQRKKKCCERRLALKYSLGVGGHLRESDVFQQEVINWPGRELCEEITLPSSFSLTPSFMIYDPRTPVGKIHCAVGYTLSLEEKDKHAVEIMSELKSGEFFLGGTIQKEYYNLLEPWSKLSLSFFEKGE